MLFLYDLISAEINSRKHLFYTFDLMKWEMGLRQMGNMPILINQQGAEGPEPEFFILTIVLF